jgi:hypothetical protein
LGVNIGVGSRYGRNIVVVSGGCTIHVAIRYAWNNGIIAQSLLNHGWRTWVEPLGSGRIIYRECGTTEIIGVETIIAISAVPTYGEYHHANQGP